MKIELGTPAPRIYMRDIPAGDSFMVNGAIHIKLSMPIARYNCVHLETGAPMAIGDTAVVTPVAAKIVTYNDEEE